MLKFSNHHQPNAEAGVSTPSRCGDIPDFFLSPFHSLINDLKIFPSAESTGNHTHRRYFPTLASLSLCGTWLQQADPCQLLGRDVTNQPGTACVSDRHRSQDHRKRNYFFLFHSFLPVHHRIQIPVHSPGSRRNKLFIAQNIAQKSNQ